MAFQRISKTALFSGLRTVSQNQAPVSCLPRRRYHIDLGAREKALLEEDPALKKFESYKNSIKRISRIGDLLTVVVVSACSYELYAVSTARKE